MEMDIENRKIYMDSIKSKSTMICETSPARYCLQTKHQSIANDLDVQKLTFEKVDINKPNKTILVVGETGTGKTTMINAMVNYILGIKREDNVWFEIVKEENKNQTQSQTTGVTVYEVFEYSLLKCSLTIIDTPGIGGTEVKGDQKVLDQLLALFRSTNGIHQLNAVGLVITANTCRLSDRQLYVFDTVLSIFGKDMENNVVALITHSDGSEPTNVLNALKEAKIPCAQINDEAVHFLFNNRQAKSLPVNEKGLKKENKAREIAWDTTEEGMEEFIKFLKTVTPQNVKMTEGVLRERKQLEAHISNLQDKIQFVELTKNEITQMQAALKLHKKEMEDNKNFTFEVDVPYKEKVDITVEWYDFDREATCCTVCEENCHYPGCWWVRDLSWCSVMKDNKCTVCTGKCSFEQHVKERKKYVTVKKKEQRTHEDIKKRFKDCENLTGESSSLMSKLQTEIMIKEREICKLCTESYQCVIKLRDMAMKALTACTVAHLGYLIGKLKELGDTDKANELEEMKRKAEEDSTQFMKYAYRGFSYLKHKVPEIHFSSLT